MQTVTSSFINSRLYIWLVLIASIAALIYTIASAHLGRKKFERKMDSLMGGLSWVSAEEFLGIDRLGRRVTPRKSKYGRPVSRPTREFVGCYILHNKTKDKYYVGQAKQVVSRVKAHLAGRGNGDVYADYKYGDDFEVRTISLVLSGYPSLNRLERDLIRRYDAYTKGYNRTRGNRG